MKCIFTGNDTDSEEHVIPAWLQKRFRLSNETMIIPNGTKLKYKHHKVPADKEANHKFGNIEQRISRGILDPAEVYLWALKIHIGCVYRDASLRFDIKDASSPFILNVTDFAQDAWLFRQLFEVWSNGGSTDPSPIGSVFIVDALHPTSTFDFIHCLITGVVGVSLGDKFVLVFLYDQGDAMRANILDQWNIWHVPRVKSLAGTPEFEDNCYIAHHVWACESAYWIYRHRRAHSMIKTPTQLLLMPPMARPMGRAADENEYRQVCRNFGLELVRYNGETSNLYQPSKLLIDP